VQVQNTVLDVCLTNAVVPVGIIGTDGPLEVSGNVSIQGPIQTTGQEMGFLYLTAVGKDGTDPIPGPLYVYGVTIGFAGTSISSMHLYDTDVSATNADVAAFSSAVASADQFFLTFPGPLFFGLGLSARFVTGVDSTGNSSANNANAVGVFYRTV
jgi:hypothetical protein